MNHWSHLFKAQELLSFYFYGTRVNHAEELLKKMKAVTIQLNSSQLYYLHMLLIQEEQSPNRVRPSVPVYLYTVGRAWCKHAYTVWRTLTFTSHAKTVQAHGTSRVFLVGCLSSERPSHVRYYFQSQHRLEPKTV